MAVAPVVLAQSRPKESCMLRTRAGRRDAGGLCAPAAERNKGPILEVLRRVLPECGLALEIASGTGQHVVHFARALPDLAWQPTERDPAMQASIAAWVGREGLANIRLPLALEVASHPWPIEGADAVLCINMIHIAPWSATTELMAGAARVLPRNGVLVLYGPYRRFGRHTADSNAAFDADLRATDPEWGVRDLESVVEVALHHGLEAGEVVPMPANNHVVVLRKATT
jgi:SAM-dependent methyltransferase